ncbi:MAG TPA: hypothetical protein VMD30_05925 [Tepidisphaeraceae bacterium]|nr:hypothetical protein [Tepidisphaeraceae bacterium]
MVQKFFLLIIGSLLIVLSTLPTAIGMWRGFQQLEQGEKLTAVNDGVALAFHPAFIACGLLGISLVFINLTWILGRWAYHRVSNRDPKKASGR